MNQSHHDDILETLPTTDNPAACVAHCYDSRSIATGFVLIDVQFRASLVLVCAVLTVHLCSYNIQQCDIRLKSTAYFFDPLCTL